MTGGAWIASYVLLWLAVVVLAFAVVVLLRQIGVLHARISPMGVHFAGEGLPQGALAPPVAGRGFQDPLTLVVFTSPTCEICAALVPALGAVERDYREVGVAVVAYGEDTAGTFRAYNVSQTPYVVAVGDDGRVRGGGVANTLEQVEELVDSALAQERTNLG